MLRIASGREGTYYFKRNVRTRLARVTGRRLTARMVLLAILVTGLVGTGAELLLLEHFDGWEQWIPLALMAVALLGVIWHGTTRSGASVRMVRAVMVSFVIAGIAGVLLHYRGNAEFELEMEPALTGWALFKAAMMGATPSLAPGAMAQLGLIGLMWCWRHPALGTARDGTTHTMDA